MKRSPTQKSTDQKAWNEVKKRAQRKAIEKMRLKRSDTPNKKTISRTKIMDSTKASVRNRRIVAKIKTPQKKLQWYCDELDRVFSLWIRQSNQDEHGNCKCVTCGKMIRWRYIQNGHYVSRKEKSLRFDEQNCAPQCGGCNKWKGGNIDFALYLQSKYGENILHILALRKSKSVKYDRFAYQAMIESYKNKILNMGGQIK